MLESLPSTEPTIGEMHLHQRQRLTDRHSFLLENILSENSHKEKYWILGTAKTNRKDNRTKITPSLKVYDVQPDLQKESYLYEVNNTLGTRTLLWIMHPNDKLSMPTIGKTINVSGVTGD